MSSEMKRIVSRATALFVALALGVSLTLISVLTPSSVHAFPGGGQVQYRAIYMSTSVPGAPATYLVSFKPASTTSITGVIVDFCQTSPIIGDSNCGSPDNGATTETFDVGGATPTVTFAGTSSGLPVTNPAPATTTGLPGTWTASGIDQIGATGRYRTLKLVSGAGGSGALSTSTIYSFAITSMKNPKQDTPGTFYARIITYTNSTPGSGAISSYAPGNEGSGPDALDYGGFALATTNTINITAKVQETLTFCTSGAIPESGSLDPQHPLLDPMDGSATTIAAGGGNSCTSATTPNLNIGHGTNALVISNEQIDTASAFMQISTNATHGAVIRMKAGNSCSGTGNNAGLSVDGGANCAIPGIDNTAAGQLVTATPNTGNAAFGLFVNTGYLTTGVSASTGSIVPDPNYNDGTHTTTTNLPTPLVNDLYYGMDNTTDTLGVASTYGDKIADTGDAPCNTVNAQLVFAAIASLTTPAGIYQGSENLIATGTF